MAASFYDLDANTSKGQPLPMSSLKGKVVLVVNTATQCGFTPQFEGLEKLYRTYKDQGLVVLGFPCNQFGSQEPLSNEEMAATCKINYGVSFPLFEKIEVNGEKAHPLFKYLKSKLGGLFGRRIKWNFTKFLIDPTGRPVKRFSPVTKPEAIEPYIKALIDR
jgi:glutathione peroxidase